MLQTDNLKIKHVPRKFEKSTKNTIILKGVVKYLKYNCSLLLY